MPETAPRRMIGVRLHLIQLAASLLALIGRHLLPSPIVVEHALTLRRWQLLETLVAPHDLIALLRRQISKSSIGLAKLLPPRLG
jgi:hypothetical protein